MAENRLYWDENDWNLTYHQGKDGAFTFQVKRPATKARENTEKLTLLGRKTFHPQQHIPQLMHMN